jgi:hypothetical protein
VKIVVSVHWSISLYNIDSGLLTHSQCLASSGSALVSIDYMTKKNSILELEIRDMLKKSFDCGDYVH